MQKIYRRLGSLRWKLFCLFLGIGLIPLMFYANTMLRIMADSYTREKEMELFSFANRLAINIGRENYISDISKRPVYDLFIKDESDKSSNRIIVVDEMGIVSNDSGKSEIGRILLSPEVLSALNNRSMSQAQSTNDYMSAAVSVINPATSKLVGAVLVVASIHDKQTLLDSMQQRLLLLTVLLSIIIIIMVFFMSQVINDPLKTILSGVKKISEGHLNQRVKFHGYDEFAELGLAFNDMTDRLEKVDASRSEFVSNVSHELKTPLSSIKVLSESLLLQDGVPVEVYIEFLRDINSEVDRMTNIINELLALVLLDRTEQALIVKPVRLNNMLDDIIKRLMPLAKQKEVSLAFNEARQVTVDGDGMKLSLAVSNIVENAIKYTNTGGGVVVVLDADSQNAIITVTDTGIGISEAEQGMIFNRFYRVDKTRDRDTGGTGLGLAISHKTVLLHNGTLRVASKENEGSCFTLKLPLNGKNSAKEGN